MDLFEWNERNMPSAPLTESSSSPQASVRGTEGLEECVSPRLPYAWGVLLRST